MRLVIFNRNHLGLVRDSSVIDVTDLVGVDDTWPPVFVLRAIASFDALKPRLVAALETRDGIPVEQVHLEAPIVFPSKIVAAPGNYRKHVEEARRQSEAFPTGGVPIDKKGVFLKAPSSLVGPGGTIELPFADRRTDHEVELGVVIGRTARRVTEGEAMAHLFGYTGLMDISVRGEEERVTRKSFDTFTPVGPMVVTVDEIPDPGNLQLQLWVNGERRQNGNTRDMIWNVPKLVSYVSHVMTLYPGDLIATGTPDGVGPIAAGDEVTIEVERIGRMTVKVAARAS